MYSSTKRTLGELFWGDFMKITELAGHLACQNYKHACNVLFLNKLFTIITMGVWFSCRQGRIKENQPDLADIFAINIVSDPETSDYTRIQQRKHIITCLCMAL